MPEDLERRTVCQVNIHENHSGHGMLPEPRHALGDAVQFGDDLHLRSYFRQQRPEVADGRFFVFDQNCFHISQGLRSGIRTQKRPLSIDMLTSRCPNS